MGSTLITAYSDAQLDSHMLQPMRYSDINIILIAEGLEILFGVVPTMSKYG